MPSIFGRKAPCPPESVIGKPKPPDPKRPSFKVGDLVQLKSGGPKMTICGFEYAFQNPECQWFDDSGHLQFSVFDPYMLKACD